jgi:hypothetical protein
MDEGDRYFQRDSAVFKTLRKIVHDLDELDVAYTIMGSLAFFALGFRRFTESVNILVTREGLKTIHERLDGLGYVPPFSKSKNLRDSEHGVRIEFLIAGEYPGDGKPKPVAFPDPAEAGVELNGITYLSLPRLVELKLASGMTGGVTRMKDLADVVALIQTLSLPAEFAESLDPFVRERYRELWEGVRQDSEEP